MNGESAIFAWRVFGSGAAIAPADFEALFLEHYAAVVRSAQRVCGSQAEAEEIAIESFLKLHAQRTLPDCPLAWLKRAALHRALDRLRENQRREQRSSADQPAPQPPDPESQAATAQQQAQVRRALAGVRPASVGTLLSRAEKRFQRTYEDLYGQP